MEMPTRQIGGVRIARHMAGGPRLVLLNPGPNVERILRISGFAIEPVVRIFGRRQELDLPMKSVEAQGYS